ncbi:MAG: hypothetical protein KC419_04205 [Anaerolineales bacterium]|nr:hypothetical protein [Anaerolineales bacterium]
MKRAAGIVLILGVICFVVGVTRIANFDWSGSSIGSKMRYIEANADLWHDDGSWGYYRRNWCRDPYIGSTT